MKLSKINLNIQSTVINILSSFEIPLDASIIDLAPGDVHLIKHLHHLGYKSLSLASFQEIKKSNFIKDTFKEVDLSSSHWFEKINKKYDVILCTEVLEHQTSAYNLILGISNLLSEEGIAIITFPNIHSIKSRLRFLFSGRFSFFFGPNFVKGHPLHDQHIFIPNLHLVRYLLGVCGLSIKKIRPVGFRSILFAQTNCLIVEKK